MSVVEPVTGWKSQVEYEPWAPWFYRFTRAACKIPLFFCIRPTVINSDILGDGACILACTHLAHLEGPCVSVLLRHRIDWMARTEMFQCRFIARILLALNLIPIQRRGIPVRALRAAIARAKSGRTIGLFPEGGVSRGIDSVCRGGAIKGGAAFISIASQVPIIPVLILGADKLHYVKAWTPFRGNRVWVVLGKPMIPPPFTAGLAAAPLRRKQRAEYSAELRQRFIELYEQTRARYPIDETLIA